MTLHFDCTQCGKCCHDLRLTLSVDEAIVWAERGHKVQVLVEALPWPGISESENARESYDQARSFPAVSGVIPIRIATILVAHNEGPCAYLQADMRCGNYAERPRICRIYPLEGRRFAPWTPRDRLCPPDAWTDDRTVLLLDGEIVDAGAAGIVEDHRRVAMEDGPAIATACRMLGLSSAGFANEGFAVHTPDPLVLAEVLRAARGAVAGDETARSWRIVTNRTGTLSMLQDAGCEADVVTRGTRYLGSFADEA